MVAAADLAAAVVVTADAALRMAEVDMAAAAAAATVLQGEAATVVDIAVEEDPNTAHTSRTLNQL